MKKKKQCSTKMFSPMNIHLYRTHEYLSRRFNLIEFYLCMLLFLKLIFLHDNIADRSRHDRLYRLLYRSD